MTVTNKGHHDPAESPRVRGSVKSAWEYRGFLWQSAVTNLYLTNADTWLGNLWLLVNPILRIVVYYVVFILVLDITRGVDNTLAFLTTGVFAYAFMRKVVMTGSRSIAGNYSLVRSFRFPRFLIPVSTSLSELAAFGPPMVVMLAVVLITGERPSFAWLALPLVVALQFSWAMGAALIAARAGYFVKDTQNILEFIFRMAFYGSGVLFLVERYSTNELFLFFVQFNPLFEYLAWYRFLLLGIPMSSWVMVGSVVWAVIAPLFGYWYFNGASARIGAD